MFSIESGDLPNKEFTVTGAGEVVLAKSLDFETRTEFVFRVAVSLGRQRDRAEVRVTVINVNDWNPAFRHPEYQFHVSEAEAVDGHRVGVVEVTDGDLGDRVSLELRGEMAAVFGADSDTGALYLRQLGRMAGGAAHLLLTARDSGDPPRCASVPVTVTFQVKDVQSTKLHGYFHKYLEKSLNTSY